MIKKYLFVILFCVTSLAQAQEQYKNWTKAKIYMKDNTVLEGRVILPYGGANEKVRFKTDPKKLSEKIPAREVEKMLLTIEYSEKIKGKRIKKTREATYIVIQHDNKGKNFAFAELLVDGKLKLVKTVIVINTHELQPTAKELNYFVRPNEKAESLSSLSQKKFSKRAATYFSDCPELIAKIENQKLSKKNDVEITKFYNTNCGN